MENKLEISITFVIFMLFIFLLYQSTNDISIVISFVSLIISALTFCFSYFSGPVFKIFEPKNGYHINDIFFDGITNSIYGKIQISIANTGRKSGFIHILQPNIKTQNDNMLISLSENFDRLLPISIEPGETWKPIFNVIFTKIPDIDLNNIFFHEYEIDIDFRTNDIFHNLWQEKIKFDIQKYFFDIVDTSNDVNIKTYNVKFPEEIIKNALSVFETLANRNTQWFQVGLQDDNNGFSTYQKENGILNVEDEFRFFSEYKKSASKQITLSKGIIIDNRKFDDLSFYLRYDQFQTTIIEIKLPNSNSIKTIFSLFDNYIKSTLNTNTRNCI